jgi:hypothetical protein
MIGVSGPTVLAILAITLVAGAAVAIWILGNRNADRGTKREK